MTSSLAFGPHPVVMIAATFVPRRDGERRYWYGVTYRGYGDPPDRLFRQLPRRPLLLLPSLISNLFQFGGGGNAPITQNGCGQCPLTVVVATLLAGAPAGYRW